MKSVVEKVTLYDLLGCALPGCLTAGVLFITIFFGKNLPDERTWDLLQSFAGYIILILVAAGYIIGVILSELARVALIWPEKLLEEKCLKEQEAGIGTEILKKRLKAAKIMENGAAGPFSLKAYWGYMYADIQCDGNYQRIHNYASSEMLCKNLCFSLLLVLYLLWTTYGWNSYFVLLMAGILLLLIRWGKFLKKKKIYTIYWFVKKYSEMA